MLNKRVHSATYSSGSRVRVVVEVHVLFFLSLHCTNYHRQHYVPYAYYLFSRACDNMQLACTPALSARADASASLYSPMIPDANIAR